MYLRRLILNIYKFNQKELQIIRETGIEPEQIIAQINKLKQGVSYIKLERPTSYNDGIIQISKDDKAYFSSLFNENKHKLKIIKFVPASGAASRMFKELINFYNNENTKPDNAIEDFIRGVKEHKFAFVSDLKNIMTEHGYDLEKVLGENKIRLVLKYLLTTNGLNYANLPKAVLKFHFDGENMKTPIDEHISEGISYARGLKDIIRIHFTISSKFNDIFSDHIKRALRKNLIEQDMFEISFSEQKKYTQTIALNENNELFKTKNGEILFRPGGHGALIQNLNDLDGDIIFIKNIDNIVSGKLVEEINYYKKILGGYLIDIRDKVFKYSEILDSINCTEELLLEIVRYCQTKLNIVFDKKFESLNKNKKEAFLKRKLSRPIRICGMVKNEGEPGGGPFWVRKKGELTLQIVESASVNVSDKVQADIFNSAEFFNPVDIVCSFKDYKGIKYDLENFVDKDAYFISEKSKDGNKLKVLELPGLWNGAMSDWISLFVEVPLITFNPAKIINNLLTPPHLKVSVK